MSGGNYQISVIDGNDCEVHEVILINAPIQVDVVLGGDMVLNQGDSAVIHAIVNVPFDSLTSIAWQGLVDPDCDICLTQIVAPFITTTFAITVSTHDGCKG